jgi:hypothetical protein
MRREVLAALIVLAIVAVFIEFDVLQHLPTSIYQKPSNDKLHQDETISEDDTNTNVNTPNPTDTEPDFDFTTYTTSSTID